MSGLNDTSGAGGETLRRLYVYNGGFLTQRRMRRILELSGYTVKLGTPGPDDLIGVWGKSPTSPRGEAVALRTDAPVLRVEDAFIRSILPGRSGEPPLGLHIDTRGVHFDASVPSDLEHLLTTHPLDDTSLMNRARDAMERLRRSHLSKYNAYLPSADVPAPGYVLVVDQTKGDASITYGGANAMTFREMLVFAQEENPGARVLIKTHPETAAGHRDGHFGPADETGNVRLFTAPVSPYALMEGATSVYTVTSQLGFEAIIAGHKPRVFGQPFYSGWGLTQDENPVPRRERKLTRAQLFAAAMILYPAWYDPYRDRLCTLEQALDTAEALVRTWREDHQGHIATRMRLWKRAPLQRIFGRQVRLQFDDTGAAVARAAAAGKSLLVWAGRETPDLAQAALTAGVPLIRVEDGFVRSKGLGADLIAPLSLVADDLGVYYDPTRESRLERLIAASVDLPDGARHRAEALTRHLLKARLSKYNLDAAALPALPEGHRILVPGQVEDDASIRLGCDDIRTNIGLLQATRAANPGAVILFKPHPDVEAGLRAGAVAMDAALALADAVLDHADPIALIGAVDEVWTMTSLLGFEALIRGKPVTCLGTPFYAGWGLTRDRGAVPDRRVARPDLAGLCHAALIEYPRYVDPLTGLPCPPEVVVERLAKGQIPRAGPANRILAKVQGMFASHAHLWR